MSIHELKEKFMQKRSYSIEDECQLLDFAKQSYVNNEISLKEFRNAIRELEELGVKSTEVIFNPNIEARQ